MQRLSVHQRDGELTVQFPTEQNLSSVRIVAYMNGAFVGIPYEMREGQQLWDILPRFHGDWVWLGSPGWYGNMTTEQRRLAVAFYETYLKVTRWYEGAWDSIDEIKAELCI